MNISTSGDRYSACSGRRKKCLHLDTSVNHLVAGWLSGQEQCQPDFRLTHSELGRHVGEIAEHNVRTSRAWRVGTVRAVAPFATLCATALRNVPPANGRDGRRSAPLLLRRRGRLLRCWPHHILAALEPRPGNPQLQHLVDQRSALQAKFGGCAIPSADHPTYCFKRVQNQIAFGVLQSSCCRRRDDTWAPANGKGLGRTP